MTFSHQRGYTPADRMNNDEDIMKGMKKEEIKLILYNNHENIQDSKTITISND